MRTKTLKMNGLLAALTLALPTAVMAAAYIWTGAGGDGQWTNAANWSANSGYPATITDDATFTNREPATIVVDADVTIRYLYANQIDVTNVFEIATGRTFAPIFYQAYDITLTNAVVISGGTFRPRGATVYVGAKTTASGTLYPSGSLTLTNTVFDLDALTGGIAIGSDGHSIGAAYGELDTQYAQIRSGSALDNLAVPTLSVSYNRGIARLYLPSAITNINVTTLYLGQYQALDTWGVTNALIVLKAPHQLRSIKVKSLAQISKGGFVYRDENDLPQVGVPPNLVVQIGEPLNRAIFRLGYMYNTPETDVRWGRFSRFEGYFSELTIGYCGNSAYVYSELDLTTTNTLELAGDITTRNVATPLLRLGGGRTGATGVLKIPGSITNLAFDALEMGYFEDLSGPPNYSILNLGSNAQTRTVSIRNTCRLGLAKFQYLDATGSLKAGFPTGTALRIGTPTQRALLQVGGASGLGTISELGTGIGVFEAWLNALNVSKCKDNWSAHTITATLDLRGATVAALDVAGNVDIGQTMGSLASVFLPPCAVACTNLTVGTTGSGTVSYDNQWYGRLHLSNTVVSAVNQVAVNQSGRIYAALAGRSCGLDLATSALTVAAPHPTTGIYGLIDLIVADDPESLTDDYFGLRLQGDATAALQALHDASPSRLTWNIAALSPRNQARFGIHYDAARDLTVVGLLRIPSGTLLLIR